LRDSLRIKSTREAERLRKPRLELAMEPHIQRRR
jgi:hypothetical protein